MVTIKIPVAELRAAYMPGRKKIGIVDVNLKYSGVSVTTLAFDRHEVVRYYQGMIHVATFQDFCGIDD